MADNLSDRSPKGLISFSSLHWILFRILRDLSIKGRHSECLNHALKCNETDFND